MIDKKAKLNSKACQLIKREYVAWLTTIGPDLAPQPRSLLKEGMMRAGQPRPVWFIWDKDSFLIFSQPHTKFALISKNTRLEFRTWVPRPNNSARNIPLRSASRPLHCAAGRRIQ